MAALEAELAEVRRRLEQLPAGVVVAQYSLQFYELAAVHLSRTPPALDEARVAIDALAAVFERVGTDMGDAAATVRDALSQLQIAFVELTRRARDGATDTVPNSDSDSESGSSPANDTT